MNHCSLVSITIVILFFSCGDNTEIIEPNTMSFSFQDGFEQTDNLIDNLFPADGSRWTSIQQVNPAAGANDITIENEIVSEGKDALRIFSMPADDILSKMDIEKQGFFATSGETITIEADLYINSDENLQDLFLLDVECCSCWDMSVSDNQCPGIRLKFSGAENYLSIERGKILERTISQNRFSFPKREWVNVRWIMQLSSEDDGYNTLIINDQIVIEEVGSNLPNQRSFREVFAAEGVNFELSEPLGYERIQIGATANPTEHEVEMYLDNFSLTITSDR